MTLEERMEFEFDTLKKLEAYLYAWAHGKEYKGKGLMDVQQLNLIYTRMYLCYMSALLALTFVSGQGPQSQLNFQNIVDICKEIVEKYENYKVSGVIKVKDPKMAKDLGFDHINLYKKERPDHGESVHQSTDEG